MAGERFAYRRTTTKKRKNLSSEETISSITDFFLDTRLFQRSAPQILPVHVFNRDQVPIALAGSYSKTIDDKNKEVI